MNAILSHNPRRGISLSEFPTCPDFVYFGKTPNVQVMLGRYGS